MYQHLNPDARLRATDAAAAVNVSRQTFNYWRRVAAISPVGYTYDGRPLYRYADVLAVEAKMRRTPQSTRPLAKAGRTLRHVVACTEDSQCQGRIASAA